MFTRCEGCSPTECVQDFPEENITTISGVKGRSLITWRAHKRKQLPKAPTNILHIFLGFTQLMFLIENKLKIVYSQKLKGLGDYVHYYGLAVVQKGASFNLNQLKGKKSCHTGVGKNVGWKIPVGYLLFTKKMTFTDNQYKSTADYFGESCAPGKIIYINLFFPSLCRNPNLPSPAKANLKTLKGC